MDKIKFTKEAIQRLKPSDKRYEVGDKKTQGLFLRIGPTGIKSFIVYKKLKGKPKRVTLGRFPDLTVESAQNKAAKIVGEIAYSEIDHNAKKRIERIRGATLGEVFEDYKKNTTLRSNTLAAYELAITRDLGDWKDKPLSEITGTMVQARHTQLSKKSETVANKAMRTLRAVYNFARDQSEDSEGHSLFPDNPTRKLKKRWNRETRRKGHISHYQLKDWFREVLRLPESQQRGDGVLARDYLTFMLLTGLRRREATSLLWSDIDLKARRFIVRDPKNHDDLWMPLPSYLVDMLAQRKQQAEADARKNQEPMEDRAFPLDDPRRFIQKVRDLSGVQFTSHDLRRTFITVAESLDIGMYTIKALVNHRSGSQNDVTEGYVQINTERLRDPMNRIADFILTAGGVLESATITELDKSKAI